MNLRQLRTLVAIGEHGSFAAAGKVIGLSPSALSLQVKGLEEELGEVLFDRALRPPVPTRAGRRLISRAHAILQQIDELSGASDEERITGRLTVGAVPTTLSGIVPKALGELRERHPDLAITVVNGSSSKLADQTYKRELDVAVITQPPQRLAGLVWRQVAEEPFLVIAPADAEGTTDRELLTRNPFIWFNRQTWAGQQIERHLNQKNMAVDARMEIDSLDAIRSMVSAGLGVSIIPDCIGAEPLPANVRVVPFGQPPSSRTIGLVHRQQNADELLVGTFHDALRGLAERLSQA
ncbi:MAG: LysR family transcriptional regulator [Pseudomonadota bacterium]